MAESIGNVVIFLKHITGIGITIIGNAYIKYLSPILVIY